ncbi:MAG TPA: DUF2911 domain-containing protein [Longimicrobiaceae bacterium]|nr:DUF2911 domain-containing protein [Longimicrobiaceae bacterium]
MSRPLRPALVVLLAGLAATGCDRWPWQDIPRSQPAQVTQKIGDATLRVVYSRPVARGRELFGGIVPYDSIWNPGANDATYISFTHDMLVGGHPLPAGNYSIWAIPRPDEWTVIFSRDWDTFHIPYPEGRDALRLRVRPRQGEHMETMAFYFPLAETDHGTLHLHWGETVIPLALRLAE